MSNFLVSLIVFALLVLQITASDSKRYNIREWNVDKSDSKRADCSFWLQGLNQFQQNWDGGKSQLLRYGNGLTSNPENNKEHLEDYFAAKPLLDQSMNGYGCADLGSCKDHWIWFKKAVEGGYVTQDYYYNFQSSCDSKVAGLVTCSDNFFGNGICDNCRCKR